LRFNKAAGLIPVAHNSGGPKFDIVSPKSGFLATTLEEYVDAINAVLELDADQLSYMQQTSRRRVLRKFSEDEFSKTFLRQMKMFI
jgi:alpha-1,2-mannosyltransferase